MANENMDINRMREEAIRRVQEMQQRANRQMRNAPPFVPAQGNNRQGNPTNFRHAAQPSPAQEQLRGGALHTPESPVHEPSETTPSAPAQNLLDGLMQDGERTLIMILLLVLFNEKADNEVIFSLLYLLL